MRAIWIAIQSGLATIGSAAATFLGGWDGIVFALIIFVAVDYLTGVIRAAYEKKLASRICWRGAVKKAMTFVIVGVGHTIDAHIIGGGTFVRDAVILFFIGSEGISLLENAAVIGLPLPPKLKAILAQLHEREDEPK